MVREGNPYTTDGVLYYLCRIIRQIFAQVIRVFLLKYSMVITNAFMVVVVIYLLNKGIYHKAFLDILFRIHIYPHVSYYNFCV